MSFEPKATCPTCGHEVGLCLAPRDARTELTPIRCLACRNEAAARDWFSENPAAGPPVRVSVKRSAIG
jgi:hypothetical protein